MSFTVFDTSYVKTNQQTLRWASVAIAGFLTFLCIIWAAVVAYKPRYSADLGTGDNRTMKMLQLALYFVFTLAATFLSWYVASLHIGKKQPHRARCAQLRGCGVDGFCVILLLQEQ